MRMTSLTLCGLLACCSLALGQEPGPRRYYPLNTPLPPTGRAGVWAGALGKATPIRFQQVQIQLPGDGQVTWYEGSMDRGILMPAPAMAGLLVGPVYRLKISDLSDFPGVELYPSIEMVDRLHPPMGRETQFPVIVPFTTEEIEAAIVGRLVTKVIYLEQPNRASPITAERGKAIPAIRVAPHENAIEVADVHGRPLAIVRLGGRVPDANRPEPGFFGTGAPIQIVAPKAPLEESITIPAPDADTAPVTAPPKSKRSTVVPPATEVPQPEEQPAEEAASGTNPKSPESTKPEAVEPEDPQPAEPTEKDSQPTEESTQESDFEPTPAVKPQPKASDFE